MGRTRVPVLVFAISATANLFFDIILIYGVGPFPALGATGAGVGSSVSAALPVPVMTVLVLSMRNRDVTEPDVERHYVGWSRIAWPAVGSAVVDYGGNIVFTAVLSASGAATLAGMRFGTQLHVLVFIVVSSISSAALYLLGKDYFEYAGIIRQSVKEIRGVFLKVGCSLGVSVLVIGLAGASVISPDQGVVEAFRVSVVIVSVLCPVAGLTYGNVTMLRLFGLTNREFVSNALGVWAAQIPFALALAMLSDGAFPFAGLFAYWGLRCCVSHIQVQKHVISGTWLVE